MAHPRFTALQLSASIIPSSSATKHSLNPPTILPLQTMLQKRVCPALLTPLQSPLKPSQTLAVACHTLAALLQTLAVALDTLATATGAAWVPLRRGLLQKLLSSWPCCPWTEAELPLVSSCYQDAQYSSWDKFSIPKFHNSLFLILFMFVFLLLFQIVYFIYIRYVAPLHRSTYLM